MSTDEYKPGMDVLNDLACAEYGEDWFDNKFSDDVRAQRAEWALKKLLVMLRNDSARAIYFDARYGTQFSISRGQWHTERAYSNLTQMKWPGRSTHSANGGMLGSWEQDYGSDILISTSAPVSSVATELSPSKNLGGRPFKYDWIAATMEMARINHHEGLPATQAELERRVADWFMTKYGESPAESEIKKRVREFYQTIRLET